MKYKPSFQYPHERNILLTTLRGILINILDRFGIEYNENNRTFYKKDSESNTEIVTLDEIMKGL